MVKTVTVQNFEEVVQTEKTVFLDYWATLCGQCMRQGPIVDALGEEGFAVGKVDVDAQPELAQRFRIMSIPTLIVFKDGKEYKKMIGLTSKEELKALLQE